jgi:hypothetical protein
LANAIYKNISFWICIEDWPRKLLGEFVFLSVAFSKKAIPNTPLPKIVEIKKTHTLTSNISRTEGNI